MDALRWEFINESQSMDLDIEECTRIFYIIQLKVDNLCSLLHNHVYT
jgi:hypothetical protein